MNRRLRDEEEFNGRKTVEEAVKDLEKEKEIQFTKPLFGKKFKGYEENAKGKAPMDNLGFIIGERSEPNEHQYRVDYDNRIGYHVNYENIHDHSQNKHIPIKTYVIENPKYEYWDALGKKHGNTEQ